MKACERRGESFIVSGQTAEARRPSKGALDHPASGQEDKAALGFFEFYHFQAHPMFGGLSRGLLPGVALIDKGQFDLVSSDLLNLPRKLADLGALLLIGRSNLQGQQMPQSIHRHVDFGSLAPLVTIVAAA